MATSTTAANRVDDDEVQHCQLVDCFCDHLVVEHHDERERHGGDDVVPCSGEAAMSTADKRPPVSRLAVEGASGAKAGGVVASRPPPGNEQEGGGRRRDGAAAGRTLPPPHAWLAIDDTNTAAMKKQQQKISDPEEEQWARLLRGGGCDGVGGRQQKLQQEQRRRSSFSVVRRERAAREAWLDRAWEMKRSWHERNGGAPDADTPVVVVVGKAHHSHDAAAAEYNSSSSSSLPSSSADHHHHEMHAATVGGGGVAMNVEEVRACRDLGLELPSDCTVEIQCYGLSGGDTSPTHTNNASSGGAGSPCAGICSPGADPMDVKARLKVWAQAVALTSTTQLGS